MQSLMLSLLTLVTLGSSHEAHAVMAESSCMNLIERKVRLEKWAGPENGLKAFERDYDLIPRERRFKIMRAAVEIAVKDLRWFSRVFGWSEYNSVIARADSILAGYDVGQANEGSMLASLETMKTSLHQALQRADVTSCPGAGSLEPVCQPYPTGPQPGAGSSLPPGVLNMRSGAAR